MRPVLWVMIACLVGLHGISPALADDARSLERGVARQDVSDRDVPSGPLATFARIESAWAEADVDALVDLFDPNEKVRLSFTRGGPRGGYFNRDQAYFLLKDMFAFAHTDRFEFEKYWNLDSEGRSPYAVAVREFRLNDGATHEDRVYLSLRRREDTWWIGEIRTIDR